MARVWDIVGGADKGGLLVREGRDLSSQQLQTRLSTGAAVEEVELLDGRLHFRRLTGSGPAEGWISVSVSGKTLAKLRAGDKTLEPAKASTSIPANTAAKASAKQASGPSRPPANNNNKNKSNFLDAAGWKFAGAGAFGKDFGAPPAAPQNAAADLARDKVRNGVSVDEWDVGAWDNNYSSVLKDRRIQPTQVDQGYFSGSQVLDERCENFCLDNGRETCMALPREALEWDDRECDMWFRSDGAFHPRDSVGLCRTPIPNSEHHLPVSQPGRVSVIMPTTEGRQKYHELIWMCFEAQDWPDKELVVVETYHHYPSMFFCEKAQEDERVKYIAFQHQADKDWSIGLKRNMAVHVSDGEFIAHFDDDDLYVHNYLTLMVKDLKRERQAQAAKLATWYMADVRTGAFAFCDPVRQGLQVGQTKENLQVRSRLYGFGFSYVYYRSLALEIPFDDLFGGEDYSFYSKVIDHLGARGINLVDDERGMCLHIKHAQNLTNSNVCKLMNLSFEQMMKLDVGSSQGFNVYMHLAGMSGQPLPLELQALAVELLGMQAPVVQVDGKTYLLGEDNIVYDPDTQEPVGEYDPKTKEIEPIILQNSNTQKPGSSQTINQSSVLLEELDVDNTEVSFSPGTAGGQPAAARGHMDAAAAPDAGDETPGGVDVYELD